MNVNTTTCPLVEVERINNEIGEVINGLVSQGKITIPEQSYFNDALLSSIKLVIAAAPFIEKQRLETISIATPFLLNSEHPNTMSINETVAVACKSISALLTMSKEDHWNSLTPVEKDEWARHTLKITSLSTEEEFIEFFTQLQKSIDLIHYHS
jgi:hypothetical protein